QCNTVFAMRMSNDRDQAFVRAAIFDTAASLLDFLPSMGMREAIVFGDGVTLPGRIRFGDLPADAMPKSRTASFTDKWQNADKDPAYLENLVARWRAAGSPDAGEAGEHILPEPMPQEPSPAPEGPPVLATDARAVPANGQNPVPPPGPDFGRG
ncbi:MAG: hypothetical protein OEM91_00820, partial [Hyphomicrobiales bacterium]|nr:hypothetical protein [Hyphomicrobiales bacterium]